MGHLALTAMTISSFDKYAIEQAHARAESLALNPTALVHTAVNGFWCFFVPPSGSKTGWDRWEAHEASKANLKDFLRQQEKEAQQSLTFQGWCEWVEVIFAQDQNEPAIVDFGG